MRHAVCVFAAWQKLRLRGIFVLTCDCFPISYIVLVSSVRGTELAHSLLLMRRRTARMLCYKSRLLRSLHPFRAVLLECAGCRSMAVSAIVLMCSMLDTIL